MWFSLGWMFDFWAMIYGCQLEQYWYDYDGDGQLDTVGTRCAP